MINPNDLTNNYLKQWLLKTYLSPADDEVWQEYESCRRSHGSLSLTEITERLILVFKLEAYTGEQVYLHAFRDLISDYTRRNNSDINRFLEFWQDTGKEKSVAAPAHQDAIRILTIHKAKGLEFKVVIIPYCTWELHANQEVYLWCKPQASPFNQLSLLPLGFSSSLKYTIFAREYYLEYQRQFIDNLNLLYVAFTRARDGLFVMCKAKENEQVSTVSDLVRQVTQSDWLQTGSLETGKSDFPSGFAQESFFQPVTVNHVAGRIKIAWQGRSFLDPSAADPARPIQEGKILHELFKAIQDAGDVKNAVNRMLLKGLISVKDRERYLKMVEDALHLPEVTDWFSNNWKILTETEIILPRGGIKRPDRVMMQAGRTLVIDYKFGSVMEAAHEKQVREYAAILRAMGHEQVEAWLWYVKMGRVVRL
jgi:ATP-dependent exoDNAse (exonuclease V) beta subunit